MSFFSVEKLPITVKNFVSVLEMPTTVYEREICLGGPGADSGARESRDGRKKGGRKEVCP